jgi:hypothetical protein
MADGGEQSTDVGVVEAGDGVSETGGNPSGETGGELEDAASGGTSQIVIRNLANGSILTNQSSTDTWIEQQIRSGRWYELQGG